MSRSIQKFLEWVVKRGLGFAIVVCPVICFFNLGVIWAYRRLARQYQEEAEKNHIVQMKNEVYKNEISLMKKREESLRFLQHDLKNHCIAMKGLLERGEYKEVRGYLQRIVQEIKVDGVWIQTNNLEIDGIVNYKLTNAERKGIKCTVDASIPDELEVDGFALAGILGNLFDNAVTAAEECENPQIEVRMTYVKQMLNILIRNTYRGSLRMQGRGLLTRKEEKRRHGYGIRSVEKLIKQCGGQMQIQHSEKIFSVFVLLPVKHKGDKRVFENETKKV